MKTFEEYKNDWISEVEESDKKGKEPSTILKGKRFSRKLIQQWLNKSISKITDDEFVFYCDGTGDGGIDVVFYDEDRNTWYIVQSKYGSAFQGNRTLWLESLKVIDTLTGKEKRLSTKVDDVLSRLKNFIRMSNPDIDRLVLLFATNSGLSESEKETASEIKKYGIDKFGTIFDVKEISIKTIYDMQDGVLLPDIKIELNSKLLKIDDNSYVGFSSLYDYWNFLDSYKNKRNIDHIFTDMNVRGYLGNEGKVNSGIVKTLESESENFNLFNNGITLVVDKTDEISENKYYLTNPFIVNGTQTSKTIYDNLNQKFGKGSGSNKDDEVNKYKNGKVVLKIINIHNNELLRKIQLYTNTQNAVKDRDFIVQSAEIDRINSIKTSIENGKYKVFIGIKRGSWEAIDKKLQKEIYNNRNVMFFDLLRIYGAGWIGIPGKARKQDLTFRPEHAEYENIMIKEKFNEDDAYACYLLYEFVDNIKDTEYNNYIKKYKYMSQSKYLFYMISIDIIKYITKNDNKKFWSKFIIKLFDDNKYSKLKNIIINWSFIFFDRYLDQDKPISIYKEKEVNSEGKLVDVNSFLKSAELRRDGELLQLKSALNIVFSYTIDEDIKKDNTITKDIKDIIESIW